MPQLGPMQHYHTTASGPIFAPMAPLPLHSIVEVGQRFDPAYYQAPFQSPPSNANYNEIEKWLDGAVEENGCVWKWKE
ncbi:Methyltransf-22 multi-domain protein [Pyrenophora tritici-repentis]|nr:Methyltransf-22 multi-domain protein [Pyrenophora tritici-repentis]